MARALAQRPLGLVKALVFNLEGPTHRDCQRSHVNGSLTSTVAHRRYAAGVTIVTSWRNECFSVQEPITSWGGRLCVYIATCEPSRVSLA